MKNKQTLLIFGLMLLLTNCGNMKDIVYSYFDGSGNNYVIDKNTIKYIPVKMSESSSGMYSGGKEKQSTVSESESSQIADMFNSISNNKSIQIEDRIMTSGLITIGNKNKSSVIIFKDTQTQEALENKLKLILNK
jgi:hypothetical protein